MNSLIQVLRAIPNVIFKLAAILSAGVGFFWIWFWVTNVWRWWRQLENPAALPEMGLLLLAAGWFLLAGIFLLLQWRINR